MFSLSFCQHDLKVFSCQLCLIFSLVANIDWMPFLYDQWEPPRTKDSFFKEEDQRITKGNTDRKRRYQFLVPLHFIEWSELSRYVQFWKGNLFVLIAINFLLYHLDSVCIQIIICTVLVGQFSYIQICVYFKALHKIFLYMYMIWYVIYE